MGAIVVVVSLAIDKGGLAHMVKDSMVLSLSEKFLGKKKNGSADVSPADKKKGTLISNFVRRRKNSSGGSLKDLGISLEESQPDMSVSQPKHNNDAENDSSLLVQKWDSYQDQDITLASVDENNKCPKKPSRFKFFSKKKTDSYIDDNGNELSNNKTKGKERKKRPSSGMSSGEEGPTIDTSEKSVRFDVLSENLEFSSQFNAQDDAEMEKID